MTRFGSPNPEQSQLPTEIKEKIISVADFLDSLAANDKNRFLNENVIPVIAEEVGKHYKILLEDENERIAGILKARRSKEAAAHISKTMVEILNIVGTALRDISLTYDSHNFTDTMTSEMWKFAKFAAITRVIDSAFNQYDVNGLTESLDVLKKIIDTNKNELFNRYLK